MSIFGKNPVVYLFEKRTHMHTSNGFVIVIAESVLSLLIVLAKLIANSQQFSEQLNFTRFDRKKPRNAFESSCIEKITITNL